MLFRSVRRKERDRPNRKSNRIEVHRKNSSFTMGLRNGKFLNFRSAMNGDESTEEFSEPSSSSLPLLSFNPLSLHSTLTNASKSLTSSITPNANNNNNNNDLSHPFIPFYSYSNLINHPSLDPRQFYPIRLEILLDRPSVSREKQIEYGWNQDDRSMNIFVKHNDPCTFHRHVIASIFLRLRRRSIFRFSFSLWRKVPMPFDRKKVLLRVSMFGKSNGKRDEALGIELI